ncbi:E3 ubiquitin-protein [Vigna angularis]|uniref:RING-type E3 ubiquitin transferase n=1 Tax=Phaseolus angularis TaxID=3914 RepID=A0A8T0JPS2_PHAAN|nr:E3 ubiquitin-protein [Vigna angularis]
MVIIIAILIVVVFLMGFFSIYICHCAHFPFASIRNLTRATSRPHRGLDQAVIDTFPTLEYSVVNIHKLGKGTLECAVCLNRFEDTETMHLIPKCDHMFHTECIDEARTTVTTESTMRRQRWRTEWSTTRGRSKMLWCRSEMLWCRSQLGQNKLNNFWSPGFSLKCRFEML